MRNKIEIILRIKRPNIISHADLNHKFNRFNINHHRTEKSRSEWGNFRRKIKKNYATKS